MKLLRVSLLFTFIVLLANVTGAKIKPSEDIGLRIVGGTKAAVGSHPHMVALITGVPDTALLCGGSLVSQRTILTAAHCLYTTDITAELLRAFVGINRVDSNATFYDLIPRSVIHPDYIPDVKLNDIGVVFTITNVVFNVLVQPVTLDFSFVSPGVLVKVAGWGRYKEYSDFAMNLQELITVVLDGKECKARWPTTAFNSNTELCTFRATGYGFCYGDSGSALTRVDNGQQIGVVSWMKPCARGYPDIYVRISSMQSWLEANIII